MRISKKVTKKKLNRMFNKIQKLRKLIKDPEHNTITNINRLISKTDSFIDAASSYIDASPDAKHCGQKWYNLYLEGLNINEIMNMEV